MSSMTKYLLLLGSAILMSGCSKEMAGDQHYSEQHRFFMKGNIDGIPFEHKAGEGNWYLETNYELEDSLLISSSSLASIEQPEQNSFYLIYRGKQRLGNESEFSLAANLQNGLYPFTDPSGYYINPNKKLISIVGDSLYGLDGYSFSLPDGSTVFSYPFSRVLDVTKDTLWPVSLNSYYQLCSSTITHYIDPASDCYASFKVDFLSNQEVELHVNRNSVAVEEVTWIVNGQTLSGKAASGQKAILSSSGIQSVEAQIRLADNCVHRVRREFPANATDMCLRDFRYSRHLHRDYDELQRGSFEMVYFDENGKRFSSRHKGVEGLFKLSSLTNNGLNEYEENTSRFFFECDVILKSDDGSSIPLNKVYGSLAIAHP